MAMFTVNQHRFDPYKNFKFRVSWDGHVVEGISRVSALTRKTEVVAHREGSAPSVPRVAPGQTKYEPIVLERGVTHDDAFENWANLAFNPQGDAAMSLRTYRKDMRIELLNLQGVVVKAYHVHRCWVSEYQPLPELTSDGGCVALEKLVLEHEGWERDECVLEPQET